MEENFRIALGLKSGNAVPTDGKTLRRGSPFEIKASADR